jgi:DNA-binding protein HU-beta
LIKVDFINQVSERTTLNKKESALAVNAFISSITTSLANGKKVMIGGFGSFRIKLRKARVSCNPRTGKRNITLPKRVPCFKAGKELRQMVDYDKSTAVNEFNKSEKGGN